MSPATTRDGGRTFRSGPYLRQLFSQAELMDARLQQDICARIQQARKEAGYTQQEMADLLGMTMRGYQNYESNRVPFRWLDKIADLTGKSQEWLLRGDVEPVEATPSRSELLQETRETRAVVESLLREVRELRQALLPGKQASG